MKLVLFIFWLCLPDLYAAPTNEVPVQDIKTALEVILGPYGNGTSSSSGGFSGGLVVMPPALTIDIINLLRWIFDASAQQSTNKVTSPKEPTNISTTKIYDKQKLHLTELDGKMYFFCRNEKVTWFDALAFCRLYGMELLSVETQKENDLIAEQIKKFETMDTVWLSGNKIGRSAFFWINGEPLIYENWHPGQPDLPATENCMVHHRNHWWDWPCESNPAHGHYAHFVCEE